MPFCHYSLVLLLKMSYSHEYIIMYTFRCYRYSPNLASGGDNDDCLVCVTEREKHNIRLLEQQMN